MAPASLNSRLVALATFQCQVYIHWRTEGTTRQLAAELGPYPMACLLVFLSGLSTACENQWGQGLGHWLLWSSKGVRVVLWDTVALLHHSSECCTFLC